MNHSTEAGKCCCSVAPKAAQNRPVSKTKATAQSVWSVLLSFLVAFFPKCPVCWAVYMSMFGSVGLANLPYMKWLLPVLILLLGIHLLMLYKKASRIGYIPFIISVTGTAAILFSRSFFPAEKWLLIIGMAFIISGSLFNSFSGTLLKLKLKQNH
jgi:mercuric ion transport protein